MVCGKHCIQHSSYFFQKLNILKNDVSKHCCNLIQAWLRLQGICASLCELPLVQQSLGRLRSVFNEDEVCSNSDVGGEDVCPTGVLAVSVPACPMIFP